MIKILTVQPKRDKTSKTKVEPVFHYEAFKNIIEDPTTRDLPYLVISLAGTKRCGKSFLANLIISFLMFSCEVSKLPSNSTLLMK